MLGGQGRGLASGSGKGRAWTERTDGLLGAPRGRRDPGGSRGGAREGRGAGPTHQARQRPRGGAHPGAPRTDRPGLRSAAVSPAAPRPPAGRGRHRHCAPWAVSVPARARLALVVWNRGEPRTAGPWGQQGTEPPRGPAGTPGDVAGLNRAAPGREGFPFSVCSGT